MFEIYKFSEVEILTFILVLARVSVFFATWPIFNSENVPTMAKILLSLIFSILVFPIVGMHKLNASALDQFYVWLLIREVLLGIVLGYIARFFLFAVSICGQIVSDSIGLSSIQILNPTVNEQSSAMEQFYLFLATLFFLTINGHHVFISGLVKSYDIIPVSLHGLNAEAFTGVTALAQAVMVSGIKLAAPVFASIFCVNIAMGIIGRAVPQINVLVTSLPVNIIVGFFVVVISIPLLLTGMGDLINDAAVGVFSILKRF